MVRQADINDLKVVSQLAYQLWPQQSPAIIEQEMAESFKKDDAITFLAFAKKRAVGFSHCQLRYDYVEGTKSSPVAYLEGIFVDRDHRRQGYGRELLSACEAWAREKHCSEFGSDSQLTDTDSLMFHLKTDFEETNRLICFVKKL